MAGPRRHSRTGSKYVTREGAKRLRTELDYLWRVERPAVTQAVAEAAAQGDRSENAEYIYGKRRLREIDRRVRFLRERLDGMIVVSQPPADRSRIFFGAWSPSSMQRVRGIATGSSAPTNSTRVPVTSAWIRRSAARCSASASGTRSRSSCRQARSACP